MNRSLFHLWRPVNNKNDLNVKNIKTMNLNFGPQHPAAHGVLRLLVQLNGEVVENCDAHVGLLHRGSEKLMEDKIYLQSLPYFDRFDYVSMVVQEHAYCLAIENLLGVSNFSNNLVQFRTLYDELTRILNHMLAIACHALDVGSMSSMFWAFEEREKIMEFYERVSGARMHAALYRPNEIEHTLLSAGLLEDILEFTRNCFTTLNEMHNVLTYNKIWKQRLVNIGVYSIKTCLDYGLTGVMARSAGIKRDLRLDKLDTYANYYFLNFRSFIGVHGDSYDRYLIRMGEMVESLNIINQVAYKLLKLRSWRLYVKGRHILKYVNKKYFYSHLNKNHYNTMEGLIKHFKYWSEGFTIGKNFSVQNVESPKGEFGVFLVSDDTNIPYKCKVRSPAYHHMQVLPVLTKGHFLADLTTLIGTIDIVFGEIDR